MMIRRRGIAWLIFVAVSASGAGEPAKIYPPGPAPDRIVLTWSKTPARSQAVTWRTDTSVHKALAEYAPAEAGPRFASKARTAAASTTLLKSDLGEAHYHTAHFDDLTPATKYAYRVGDGTNWSEWNHFRTAGDKPAPFTFLYFGDAQYQIKEHWSRVVREAYSAAPRASFAIHAGDLINIANRDSEWGEWFEAAGWINRTLPVIPTPGNHELAGDADGRLALAQHWKVQFALPENGPPGLQHSVYYLDYQGVRIISLNSNEKRAEQVDWLERVLSANPHRWTVVTFHHPILSASEGRDNPELRKLWQPVFDKYRVDLVLQGHDHCYGRSGLEGFASGGGTVYVVSVSGPGFYQLDPQGWMRRWGQGKQLFQVIHVDGDRLHYEARTAVGKLHDNFVLRKQPGRQPNVLSDGPSAPDSRQIPSKDEPWNGMPLVAIMLLVALLVALRIIRYRRKTPAVLFTRPLSPR